MDPDLIRGLDVGQAAYIYRGGVTYVQVKRLVAGPAELAAAGPGRPPERAGSGRRPPAGGRTAPGAVRGRVPVTAGGPRGGPGARRDPAADVSALLDEAFGEEPAMSSAARRTTRSPPSACRPGRA